MNIRKLLTRSAAFVTFTGLGAFDVFAIRKEGGRLYVGAVLMDTDRPPFRQGDGKDFKYAPGYVLFARGL